MKKLALVLFIIGVSFVPSVAFTDNNQIPTIQETIITPYRSLRAATSTIKPIEQVEIQEPVKTNNEVEISDDIVSIEITPDIPDGSETTRLDIIEDSLESLHAQHGAEYDELFGFIEELALELYEHKHNDSEGH